MPISDIAAYRGEHVRLHGALCLKGTYYLKENTCLHDTFANLLIMALSDHFMGDMPFRYINMILFDKINFTGY